MATSYMQRIVFAIPQLPLHCRCGATLGEALRIYAQRCGSRNSSAAPKPMPGLEVAELRMKGGDGRRPKQSHEGAGSQVGGCYGG